MMSTIHHPIKNTAIGKKGTNIIQNLKYIQIALTSFGIETTAK